MGLQEILFFLSGLFLLVIGAEALVRGSSRLAAIAGVSPLVIGLTIVAFGTSSPETAVSVVSSIKGQADLSVGNVVDSNIFNILCILGLSALIIPLGVSRQLIRFDVPVMILSSALLFLFGLNGNISRGEGVIFLTGIFAYTGILLYKSKKESAAIKEEYEKEFGFHNGRSLKKWAVNILLIIIGLALLVIGSKWLVDGATAMARSLGASELIVGLTIVAAGTSLPELATSVLASIRGERDIAVGNIIGSNVYNILGVLGLSSVVNAGGIKVSRAATAFDIPVMAAVAAACLPVFLTGRMISRWEGALFFAYYLAYTAYLILLATGHHFTGAYAFWFSSAIIPATIVVLLFTLISGLRRARRKP